MNYKIAVQMYGHLRTFEECAPYLRKYVLDLYDCDVFMHTWDVTNHKDKSWYREEARSETLPVDDTMVDKLYRIYGLKSVLVEEQVMFDDPGYFGKSKTIRIALKGVKSMTYSQFMSNNLRKEYAKAHNISYDYVVVIRPDIQPREKLLIEYYSNEFRYFDKVSIHFVQDSVNYLKEKKYINYPLAGDCFYFGTPDIVSAITDVYRKFDYYYKDMCSILPNGIDNPETAFFEQLHQKGILPRQYHTDYIIKRTNRDHDIRMQYHEIPKILIDCFEFILKKKIPILVQLVHMLDKISTKFYLAITHAKEQARK